MPEVDGYAMNGALPAGDIRAGYRERRAFRARFVGGYVLSYAIDASLLGLFAAAGTIALWIPIAYFAAGAATGVVFGYLILFGVTERYEDPYVTLWQTFASSMIMLVFLAVAPEVGFLFLCTLFLVFGFGSLRMSARNALFAVSLIVIGSGVVLHLTPDISWLPHSTPLEILLVWTAFTLILVRLVILGLIGSGLRIRAVKAYRLMKASVGALEARTSELAEAEERLKNSLREKDLLLREVHHAVKNNLQAIASMLQLGADAAGNEQATATLNASRNRILTMGLVHEQVYASADLAGINMRCYLQALAENVQQSREGDGTRAVIQTELEDVILSADQVVPLGLIVNELLTNAFKHAFPEGRTGTVRLSLHLRADGMVELVVADDGVGLPADLDWRRPGTLGLDLVNGLARQLDGNIALESERGTRICVRFRRT